jgi:hypothetical protein
MLAREPVGEGDEAFMVLRLLFQLPAGKRRMYLDRQALHLAPHP